MKPLTIKQDNVDIMIFDVSEIYKCIKGINLDQQISRNQYLDINNNILYKDYNNYIGKCVIYSLLDPDTFEIRYVGKSTSVFKRYNGHISNAKNKRDSLRTTNWICSILKKGNFPILKIIDIINIDHWELYEKYYISEFRLICNLINHSGGGKGGVFNDGRKGVPLTEDHKNKIRISNTGKKLSDFTKKIISDVKTGLVASDATKQKMSYSRTGIKKSESYINKLSDRMKINNISKRDDVRRKMSDTRKKLKCGSKKIIQFDKNMVMIKEWDSIIDAANFLSLDSGGIIKVCKEKRKTCGGYIWKYKELEEC